MLFRSYTLRENLKTLGIALPLHMDCNHVFYFNLEVKIVKKKMCTKYAVVIASV